MPSVLQEPGHVAAIVGGMFFLYASILLYEDEHGRIQNTLERWWARLDDARYTAVSRQVAFTHEIASVENRALERLFGKSLFSFRALAVSNSFSLASLGFVALLSLLFLSLNRHARSDPGGAGLILFAAVFLVIYLLLGLLPAMLKPRWHKLWFALVFAAVWMPILGMVVLGIVQGPIYLVALMVTFGCAVAFIVLTRWTVERAAAMDRLLEIMGVIVANLLLGLLLLSPLYVLVNWFHPKTPDDVARLPRAWAVAGVVAVFNILPAILAFVFVFLAALMLLHRLFWPMVQRPVYAMQALGIARRRSLLGMGFRACVPDAWHNVGGGNNKKIGRGARASRNGFRRS